MLSKEPSGLLRGYDVIEYLDMIGPTSKESPDPFRAQASDLNGIETDRKVTGSGEPDTTRGQGLSSSREAGSLPTLDELLLGSGAAPKKQQTSSGGRYVTGESGGNFEQAVNDNHIGAAVPTSSEGENPSRFISFICRPRRC